mgnify:FL=1
MIQFNLLPDVKIAYIKAQRQKRLVIFVSTIASVAAVVLFVLLFTFANIVQRKSIDDLTRDIDTASKNLTGTEDINKILTIQNQLNSLEDLHSKKVVATRLFSYMQQVTPAQVSISSIDIDFMQNTLTIGGKAPNLLATNTYADSLKFTTFKTESSGDNKTPAFSNVVLAGFSVGEGDASYSFNLSFDPMLFAQAEEVTLEVPKMITTRSNTELPGNELFQRSQGGQ